jgi:phage shock protein A
MADRTRISMLEELRQAVRDKERELSELDLILADYHTEHSRLLRELRRLRAQLRDEEEAVSSVPEP